MSVMQNIKPKMHLVIYLLQAILPCYAGADEHYVYPRILQQRSAEGNMVLKLNDKLTLNLERSKVLADSLLFVTTDKDLHEVDMVDTSHIQENIYHDTRYQSSLMVRQKEGNVEVEGIVNHNLRIKPIPEGERSAEGQMVHKIFQVDTIEENVIKPEPELSRLRERYDRKNSNDSRRGSDVPESRAARVDKFPVELHVLSDKVHQKGFKKNDELIAYLAVLTNAVNLRYLDTVSPKISFLLVGVTRVRSHDFASSDGRDINALDSLRGLQAYRNKGSIPGNHDIVYLATGLDIFLMNDGRIMNKGVAGIANVGAACSTQAVAQGEDTPHAYNGAQTMAHELAHSLGSQHDETPDCPWSQGYLMSSVDGGTRNYQLSKCTEKSIRKYLATRSQECFRIMSEQNYLRNHKRLPGQSVTAQHFCQQLSPKGSKQKIKAVARKMHDCHLNCCYLKFGSSSCIKYNMPDGMTCKPGKTCKRGVCSNH
uniref:Reprolysin n=1 Tax=Rhipicephalus appendiculatus TaxID=34631 RepID=A0A131YL36_RHIAP